MPAKKEKVKKADVENYFKVNRLYRKYYKVREALNNFLKKNLPLNKNVKFGKYNAKVIKTTRKVCNLEKLKRIDPKTYRKCVEEIPVYTLEVKDMS